MVITADEWNLIRSVFDREVSPCTSEPSGPEGESTSKCVRHHAEARCTDVQRHLTVPHARAQSMEQLSPRKSTWPQEKVAASLGLPPSALPTKADAVVLQAPARKLWDDYNFLSKSRRNGRSGDVRQAEHNDTGCRVTVKSCGARTADADLRHIIAAAMEAHGRLDHKHVVKLVGVYTGPFAIHMVMERLEGGDLCSALAQRGRFSEEDAKVVVRQVLLAVDHMHQHNVVHRDIKLESIMFAEADGSTATLIDFALATQWDGRTEMKLECGSTAFSSPEMLRGAYTEKTDMWSVGVVAYMLLTGEPLFRGSEWEIRTQAKAGRALLCKQLYACSIPAQEFVASLLMHNPEQRLSAEEALHHPWFN